MNKYVKIAIFLLLTLKISIVGQEFDKSVVKNASYCVSKKAKDSNIVIYHYYTFNGNYLAKISYDRDVLGDDYHIELSKIRKKLDKNAPKPQPTYYIIRYRRAFKGSSGYRIYFFDKHENLIKFYWYDKKENLIKDVICKKNYTFPLNRLSFMKLYPDFPLDLGIVKGTFFSFITNYFKDYGTWNNEAEFLGKYDCKDDNVSIAKPSLKDKKIAIGIMKIDQLLKNLYAKRKRK